jgi:hypothetical protein
VPQGSYPFSRPSVSLFDLAAVSSSPPTHPSGRRAQELAVLPLAAQPSEKGAFQAFGVSVSAGLILL